MCNLLHKKMPWASSSGTCSLWKKITASALPDYKQVIKPPVLKDLLRLLVFLSSERQWNFQQEFDSYEFDLEMDHGSEDICKLSDILFKELEERFEQCFSICNASHHKDVGGCSFYFSLYDAMEVLYLLLRCCIALLALIIDNENLRLEKGKVLLMIIARVCSVNLSDEIGEHAFVFEKSVHDKSPEGDNCFSKSAVNSSASLCSPEPHNMLLFFKSTILEVLIDELLVHEQLRGHLEKVCSAASVSDDQFYPLFAKGGIGIVMSAICHHFILTFSDKQEVGNFIDRLFYVHATEFIYPLRAPALGVTAAVSLLSSPMLNCTPKYVQAHVISLVSKAMVNTGSAKPDHKLIKCFLSTFEKSANMYIAHMPGCHRDGSSACASGSITSKTLHKIAYPSLESYMSGDMKKKVHNLINELDNSLNLNLRDSLTRKKSDLVSSSISFVKEYQNVCESSCQDEIVSILTYLIHKASESLGCTALDPSMGTMLQNKFLLASLLKLMSISLLQALRCLRHSDDPGSLEVLKDFSSCKEYDFILGSVKCFKDMQFSFPLQEDLSNVLSCHSTRHRDSQMMFLYFCGLMWQSFASGCDSLVKGCLLAIMAVLNLFVFEEGNLDALSSMVGCCLESHPARSPHIVRVPEDVAGQNSAFMVASKFQKLHRLRVSKLGNNCVGMETSPSFSGRASNGEVFFECLWNMGQKRSNVEDIVDFVECEEPDEYSAWFKNRLRYRKKKGEREVLRWKKKKKKKRCWRKTS